YIGGVYVGLTAACAAAYAVAGMSAFDAVNHAMTTLSTGGYSTHDASFGHFKEPAIPLIGTFFMASGALPFVLYIKSLKGNWGALWRDEQVRGFLKLIAFATLGMAGWLCVVDGVAILEAIEMAVFNVTSVVTTTGYASADYGTWGAFPVGIFLLLTFLGGCTGSTSGAIKVFRHQVMYLMMRRQIKLFTFPRGVFPTRYNGTTLSDDIVPSVIAFIAAFFAAVGLLTLALCFLNLDLVTSFSGAATAIANVGPGLGPIIGPSGNFAPLPDTAKWLLALGMLLGRLEIFTVLVVFTPAFWRG
ncbi:MAG: potassium transporter TrkG, partial [Rhodospirillales bacterium]